MKLTTLFLKLRGNPLSASRYPSYLEELRKRPYPQPAPLPPRMGRNYHVRQRNIGNGSVLTLSPKSGLINRTIMYIHGGAFVHQLAVEHWRIIHQLSSRLQAEIIVPVYPLAPEYDYKSTCEFMESAYRAARNPDSRPFFLAGDSAGGCIALSMTMSRRDRKEYMPQGIILFSPWTDLSLRNPEAKSCEPGDLLLGVDALREFSRWWCAGGDSSLPQFSPINGELAGLPPIYMFQGSADILMPDTRLFAQKARKAGVRVLYREYPGAFHIFVGATFTAEARDVFYVLSEAFRV